jgi:hypothetical protein
VDKSFIYFQEAQDDSDFSEGPSEDDIIDSDFDDSEEESDDEEVSKLVSMYYLSSVLVPSFV